MFEARILNEIAIYTVFIFYMLKSYHEVNYDCTPLRFCMIDAKVIWDKLATVYEKII